MRMLWQLVCVGWSKVMLSSRYLILNGPLLGRNEKVLYDCPTMFILDYVEGLEQT